MMSAIWDTVHCLGGEQAYIIAVWKSIVSEFVYVFLYLRSVSKRHKCTMDNNVIYL